MPCHNSLLNYNWHLINLFPLNAYHLFLINAQGATTIKSTAANIFLVQNQNSTNILTVSQSGVIVIATQSVELSNPAPNGGIYFTSNSFFIGLD